jgi:hypothetical protein
MNVNRAVLMDFLHLFALVGFAVAQPVYDILGQNPEFFVAHRANPAHIIMMVLTLSLGLVLGLMVVELVAWVFGERVRRSVHWGFVFSLAVLTVLPMVKRMAGGADLGIVGIALLLGLVFVVLYVRWQAVRLFLTVLSPAVVAFPLWFLLLTPVSQLVLPDVIEAKTGIEIDNPVPVVLVVLDEFNVTALLDSAGRIDPIRFPNFAALAAESWWFPNAVATYVETTVAVPAILTGQNPKTDTRLNPTANDYPHNLFTMLGERYRLNVLESLTLLCPEALCRQKEDAGMLARYAAFFADVAAIYLHIITPPQLERELPSLDAQWTGFGGALMGGGASFTEHEVDSRLERQARGNNNRDLQLDSFLSQIEQSSNTELHFLHVVLPHTKYEYLVSGHQYLTERPQIPVGWIEGPGWGGRWIGEKPLILTAYHRHLQQIGYLDRFLGKLRNLLEKNHLYENALIILTADHGVSFRAGLSMREVQNGNQSDILKVPMLVKLPGQHEGRISERLVSGIDVLPTIADVLGVRVPWDMDGRSMLFDEELPRTEIEIPGVGRFHAKEIEGFPRLEWQVEHFGEHTSLDRLVPKGPYPSLIGQAIADVRIGESAALQFHNGDLEYLEDVNPVSGFLPSLFMGHIVGSNERNLPIAVALNSQIWATTTTSAWEGKQNYFSVLLPPAAFKKGENVVGVYRIEETEGILLPVPVGRPKVRFHYGRSGQMKLVFSDNREISVNIDRGFMQGNLDSVSLIGTKLVLSGWGVDVKGNRPAAEVLIFAGEQLVSRVEPDSRRPDVADAHQQQNLLHSGFDAIVPVEALNAPASEIRVILVSQGDRTLGLSFSEEQMNVIRAALKNKAFSH